METDNSMVSDLERVIEKYITNTWLDSEQEHQNTYSLWSDFEVNEIAYINGMTMNTDFDLAYLNALKNKLHKRKT